MSGEKTNEGKKSFQDREEIKKNVWKDEKDMEKEEKKERGKKQLEESRGINEKGVIKKRDTTLREKKQKRVRSGMSRKGGRTGEIIKQGGKGKNTRKKEEGKAVTGLKWLKIPGEKKKKDRKEAEVKKAQMEEESVKKKLGKEKVKKGQGEEELKEKVHTEEGIREIKTKNKVKEKLWKEKEMLRKGEEKLNNVGEEEKPKKARRKETIRKEGNRKAEVSKRESRTEEELKKDSDIEQEQKMVMRKVKEAEKKRGKEDREKEKETKKNGMIQKEEKTERSAPSQHISQKKPPGLTASAPGSMRYTDSSGYRASKDGHSIHSNSKAMKDKGAEKKLTSAKTSWVKNGTIQWEEPATKKSSRNWKPQEAGRRTEKLKAPGVKKTRMKVRNMSADAKMRENQSYWQRRSVESTDSEELQSALEGSGARQSTEQPEPKFINWDENYGKYEEDEEYYYFIIEEREEGKALPPPIFLGKQYWEIPKLEEPMTGVPKKLNETEESTDGKGVTEPTEEEDATEPTDGEDVTELTEEEDVTELMEEDKVESTEGEGFSEPKEEEDVTEVSEEEKLPDYTEEEEVTDSTDVEKFKKAPKVERVKDPTKVVKAAEPQQVKKVPIQTKVKKVKKPTEMEEFTESEEEEKEDDEEEEEEAAEEEEEEEEEAEEEEEEEEEGIEEKTDPENKSEEEKEETQKDEYVEVKIKRKRKNKWKPPNTTLKRAATFLLPSICIRFLWSEGRDFYITKVFLGAGFGGFVAIGLFFLIIDPLNLNEDRKMGLLYPLFGACVLGWATSPLFRCACFLILPLVLGKEGRTYMIIYVMSAIYAGPVGNIENNLDNVVESIGCAVELQINHTKMMWKVMIAPLKSIVGNMVKEGKELSRDTNKIKKEFEPIKEQVMSKAGLNEKSEAEEEAKEIKKEEERKKKEEEEKKKVEEKKKKEEEEKKKVEEKKKKEEEKKNMKESVKEGAKKFKLPTQKLFEIKTMLRCEYIAEEAEKRCRDWFDMKHEKCMRTIWLPLLNHLLCLPMKFKFLCKLVHLMTTWCKSKIPVEGNFGTTYDNVDSTLTNLSSQFEINMAVKKEEKPLIPVVNISTPEMMEEVKSGISDKKTKLNKMLIIMQAILALSVLLIFVAAFSYIRKYNGDILFDNIYITTYFKQIDARRKKLEKRTLLPLKKGEALNYIFPFQIGILGCEKMAVIRELLHCIPIIIFVIAVCIIDHLLTVIFQIIRKRASVEYTFKSAHEIGVFVGGDSLIARLLRKTIGLLNSRSETEMKSDNTRCLPNPEPMDAMDYFMISWPILLLALLCILQAYMHRIRRAIATFFFPKREKKRILFLYNEMLRRRGFYIINVKKRIMARARKQRRMKTGASGPLHRFFARFKWFNRKRCIVCKAKQNKNSVVCNNEECETVYCLQCWVDMGKVCYACLPQTEDDFMSGESDYEEQLQYGG